MLNKYLNKLKTSEKISLAFSLFNFISLCLLLLSINIIYFFIWYGNQKEESLKDINKKYGELSIFSNSEDIEKFKIFLLKKDVLIIPEGGGKLLCSKSVGKKIHDDISKIKNAHFYNYDNKVYFIFSKYYKGIGLIKILFDTTTYVRSQIIIIKITIFIILFFIFIYYFFGKIFAKYSLRKLNDISNQAKKINLNKKIEIIKIEAHPKDEIMVLVDTLNLAFKKIEYQSENQKQFITDVSHEFKTPLMIINSDIDLYYKKVEKNKISKNDIFILLNSIKKNTKKLNKVLETMFLLSRFQDKIVDFNKTPIKLGKYIKEFSSLLFDSINNKDIKIKFLLDYNIILDIEKATFNILLENIITNAVKFSNFGGDIEIGLNEKSFWIKDTGIGIKFLEKKQIWNKFFKTDEKIEGFGIGLFIVKRIIKLYKWDIMVESNIGKGTKIIVNFLGNEK